MDFEKWLDTITPDTDEIYQLYHAVAGNESVGEINLRATDEPAQISVLHPRASEIILLRGEADRQKFLGTILRKYTIQADGSILDIETWYRLAKKGDIS
ncbi:MAG: hypothetical protein HDR80_09720 [Bacteroides sp.]|nr:hypothetical protein [Bacteroides sp.]